MFKHRKETYARKLWENLEKEYGTTGIGTLHAEITAALTTILPINEDPSPALDKFRSHFVRMKEAKIDVPEEFQTLLMLYMMPPSMNIIRQLFIHQNDIAKLKYDELRTSILLDWDSRKKNPKPQQAKKISAVKRNQGNPQFNQQAPQDGLQQQDGQGLRKRTRRRETKKGVLMLVAALVMLGNVLIWTV